MSEILREGRGWVVGGVLAAWLSACGHARSIGPAEAAATNETPTAAHEEGSPRTKEPPVPKRQRATPNGDIEIASTPGALLTPGGARAIQARLVHAGELTGEPSGELDGPTRAALARFQRTHALPATGVPDDATVKKLGLDVGKVFRSAGQR